MNKIPKIIHYCWFGRGEKPELAQKCIESWKKHLPEYEIKEWNEENFNVNINKYCSEAYSAKKYAFVTDYVRLYALYNEGGIYMDTDVEVLKSLDEFLKHPAFSGFENNNKVPTGIMAAKKNNKWIKTLLDDYKDKCFIKNNGEMDLTTNVETITNVCIKEYGLNPNNTYQELKQQVVFYPHDWFCPKDWHTGKIEITDNTHTIHHFNGSWHTKKEKKQIAKKRKLIEKYGEKTGNEKYLKYLKKQKIMNYLTYPVKAIKNPKRAIKILKGEK